MRIEPVSELEDAHIDDGVSCHNFGSSAEDFTRLSKELQQLMPKGLVLFHLDRNTTLVFVPGDKTKLVGAGSALSWLRKFGCMGILMRSRGAHNEFAIVDVLWNRRQPHQAAFRRSILLSIVAKFKEGGPV